MASVNAFRAIDMLSNTVIYGALKRADGSVIEIVAGAYSSKYIGNFTYDNLGAVFGQLTGYESLYNGVLAVKVTDFSIDAYETFTEISSSQLQNTYQKALANDDLISGSSFSDRLLGYTGNDELNGGGGNDSLYGGAGDDVLYGGGSNDLVDGDVGNDIAAYLGVKGSYKLTLGPSSTTITDRNGSEGTDTLINIEKLAFNGHTLDLTNYSSLTQLSNTQFKALAEVYVAYFNRAADAEGLYFWADKLAEGMDMATIASYFSQSAEAKALYPNTADTSAFVTAVYANVLGRTPDQAGFEFWTTNLNNGSMQPATFVLSIIGGAQGPDITYLSTRRI